MHTFTLSNFSAVIFDMDGLVLDTEITYFSAWQQAAAQLGYTLSAEFCASLSGLNGAAVQQKLVAHCGANFDVLTFNQLAGKAWRDTVQRDGIAVKRGFHDLFHFIQQQKIPVCLATNSRKANALDCLALAGLEDFFSTIISRDDVQHSKPAPDIFLAAAACLQVPIQQCLVLEDSPAGIMAAYTAGAYSVFVPSTQPVDTLTLHYCSIMRLDLSAVLDSFRASCLTPV